MTAAHVPAVAALEQACFSRPWSEQALAEELCNPAAHFLVAVEGEAVTGYMGLLTVLDECSVTNIAVSPAYRRRGIASSLLRAQIAWAKEAGMARMMLEVRAANAGAIALYEREGFHKDGVRPRFYEAPLEDAILYSIDLKD